MIPARSSKKTIDIKTPEGECVGILYDFVFGEEPDGKKESEKLGWQIAKLHNLMEKYPFKIRNLTKTDYLDEYILIMDQLNYTPDRINDLKQYGDELWGRMNNLPKSFCHGDMHTGNMLRSVTGDKSNYCPNLCLSADGKLTYVLFDFDDASGDYPVMDVAYLSDDTDFFQFSEAGYDKVLKLFERFYKGYSKERILSDIEIQSIFDFIAVRHYQINARIWRCQGLQCIGFNNLDEQYEWLMKWRNLCEKKILLS